MYEINYSELKPVNYNRKSSESEEKQMLSIDSQVDENKKITNQLGVKILDVLKESKSGKMEKKRPIFTQMIKDLKSGKYDSIVCWKLDRLARNMIDGGVIMDMLQRGVIKCIITPNKIYLSSENTLLMAVEFGSANQFVRDLSVNVKRGQTKKASMGFPHGVATLGFLNDKSEEKGNRKWKVDKTRLSKINLLLRKFLEGGYTGGKLYDYAINELGLTTVPRGKSGGMPIMRSRIYEILKDSIYAGFFFYGGNRYELHKSLPRIITESEHVKILRLLGQHSLPKVQDHKTVYSGLVKSSMGHVLSQDVKLQVICDCKKKFSYTTSSICPTCGTDIPQMVSPKLLEYSYHYDNRKKKSKQKYKSVTEKRITNELIAVAVTDFPLSPDILNWSKANLYQLKDGDFQNELNAEINVEEDKKKYTEEKLHARAMLRNQQITSEEYNADLVDIEVRYKHVSKKKSNDEVDWMSRLNEIASFSESITEVLKNGSLDQKRKVLFALGSNLVWNEENLCITWFKSIQALIDGVKGMRAKLPEFEPNLSFEEQGLNEKTSLKRDVFSTMLRE